MKFHQFSENIRHTKHYDVTHNIIKTYIYYFKHVTVWTIVNKIKDKIVHASLYLNRLFAQSLGTHNLIPNRGKISFFSTAPTPGAHPASYAIGTVG